jgi:hypothetical protein
MPSTIGFVPLVVAAGIASPVSPLSLAVVGRTADAPVGPTAAATARVAVLAVAALVGVVALVLGAVAAGPRRSRDPDQSP